MQQPSQPSQPQQPSPQHPSPSSQQPSAPQPQHQARARRAPRLLERAAVALTPARAITLLVVLGLAWRGLRYGLAFPYWGDESFVGVNFVLSDFRDLVDPLKYGQIVPLLFMWAELAISRVLGVGELSLRLLPFIAGAAALLLFWRFCAAVLPRRAVALAVGFLACSYYAVRHGAELKPYASDLLVSLLLTCAAWAVLSAPSRLRWIMLIVLAGAAPWASYPAVFVCGGIGLMLAWRAVYPRADRHPPAPPAPTPSGAGSALIRRVGPSLAYLLVLGVSFVAMYVIYARPHAQAAAALTETAMWSQAFPPLREPWLLPGWLLVIHSGLMMAYPLGGTAPGSAATLLLVIVGVVQLWRVNRTLVLLLLAPLPLNFIAAALQSYPYGGTVRTSIFLAPAFCLLGGCGLHVTLRCFYRDALRRLRRAGARAPQIERAGPSAATATRRDGSYVRMLQLLGPLLRYRYGALLAIGLLAAIPIAGMIGDVRAPYASEAVLRSHRAVRAIAARTQPGDRWITFNAAWGRVDYAPWLGDWHGTGGQFVFDALRFAPVPLEWAPPAAHVAGAPGRRVFLLSYRGFKAIFPQAQLDEYVATLTQRWGAPEYERFFIKDKKQPPDLEALDVYTFRIP